MTRPPVLATLLALVTIACTTPTTPSGTSSSSASGGGSTTPALTPARALAGTWKTALPVTFHYQTDLCGRQTVANALWNVTWVVTAASGFTNVLNIDMYVSSGSAALVGGCGATGYVGWISPTSFQATLSSSAMTQAPGTKSGIQFSGNFTTDLMQLTWNHWECPFICYGEFTDTLAFKMVRQ